MMVYEEGFRCFAIGGMPGRSEYGYDHVGGNFRVITPIESVFLPFLTYQAPPSYLPRGL